MSEPSGKRPGKARKPADQVRAEKLGKIPAEEVEEAIEAFLEAEAIDGLYEGE